jgi:hypothetical protein
MKKFYFKTVVNELPVQVLAEGEPGEDTWSIVSVAVEGDTSVLPEDLDDETLEVLYSEGIKAILEGQIELF